MCINSICEWCGFHQNTLQTLFSTCSTLFWPLRDDPFCGCHTFISRVLKIPSFLSSQRAASWFIPNTLCTHTLSLQNQFLEDGCDPLVMSCSFSFSCYLKSRVVFFTLAVAVTPPDCLPADFGREIPSVSAARIWGFPRPLWIYRHHTCCSPLWQNS